MFFNEPKSCNCQEERIDFSSHEVLALSGSKSSVWFRVSSVLGIIGPVFTFILIFSAISQAPWFTWTGNALSDLGVHEESALLFNSGLIIGGILDVVFAFGVMRFYQNRRIGRDGAFFLLLASIFLTSIGIFPETTPNNIHFIVSVAFFAMFPVSLLIQSAAMLAMPTHKKLGAFTIIMAIVAIIPWTIWIPLKPYRGVAIPELVSALAAATWSIVMSSTLLKEKQTA